MSDLIDLYLNSSSSVSIVTLVELSHPSFGRVFRYQYFDDDGLFVNGKFFDYAPFNLSKPNVSTDLNQTYNLTITDYEDELVNAFKSISDDTPMLLDVHEFRSDILTNPLESTVGLFVSKLSKDESGKVTFEATPKQINNTQTGESYDLNKYPLLRGTT